MLLYQPRFRNTAVASMPPNHAEAHKLADLSPVYPSLTELGVAVTAPSGQVLAADDPALLKMIGGRIRRPASLIQSHRAMTDCRPSR